MKKKITAVALVICLLAVAVVGGTLAYFTDTDDATNTFTVGNVDIIQNEYGDSSKTAFEQDQVLLPTTEAPAYDNGGLWKTFSNANAITKFITVENEAAASSKGTEAYVRTVVLYERNIAKDLIGIVINDQKVTPDTQWKWNDAIYACGATDGISIDGKNYIWGVATYQIPLEAATETEPCFSGVYLVSTATNEDAAALDCNGNGTFEIYAVTQAAQAAGFASAEEALDKAFGEITAANVADLFAGMI